MRTKIKICGITNIEDALADSNLDIDYIGLIFIYGCQHFVNKVMKYIK